MRGRCHTELPECLLPVVLTALPSSTPAVVRGAGRPIPAALPPPWARNSWLGRRPPRALWAVYVGWAAFPNGWCRLTCPWGPGCSVAACSRVGCLRGACLCVAVSASAHTPAPSVLLPSVASVLLLTVLLPLRCLPPCRAVAHQLLPSVLCCCPLHCCSPCCCLCAVLLLPVLPPYVPAFGPCCCPPCCASSSRAAACMLCCCCPCARRRALPPPHAPDPLRASPCALRAPGVPSLSRGPAGPGRLVARPVRAGPSGRCWLYGAGVLLREPAAGAGFAPGCPYCPL
jgi:hypothetical protein